MPHSVTPDSTPQGQSQASSVIIKAETQDIDMADAPGLAVEEKTKVNLEDLFDDEDSDGEFTSSAPQVKSEDESSQPQPIPK